ncbi:hypothetical protein NP233_g10203 [Leucocoprinus birnbaumii]|uniref:Zn(2)-C6 fungal-type domain-containing protein n=1 Tax=Leucocoprinus birnbaumii TaxID=56174 RepID=A0AAD5VIP9_9AGAR|nr:hypothetical protein NP233_g10203 [Leucocoprinus birnbaumii]
MLLARENFVIDITLNRAPTLLITSEAMEPTPSPQNSSTAASALPAACAECKSLKIECDRQTPCSNCIKRHTVDRCRSLGTEVLQQPTFTRGLDPSTLREIKISLARLGLKPESLTTPTHNETNLEDERSENSIPREIACLQLWDAYTLNMSFVEVGMCILTNSSVPDHIMLNAILSDQSLPRVYPGTRLSIMEEIFHWFAHEGKRKLLWLTGFAAVGKSTIMRTVAYDQVIGSPITLFISGDVQCDDSTKVFPTISFQFFCASELYRTYIAEKVYSKVRLPEMGVEEQFYWLFSKPFGEDQIFGEGNKHLVLLDALDFCRSAGSQSATKDSASKDGTQTLIITLIARFILDYPNAPISWIISSRPEAHVKAAFTHPAVQPSYQELHVPIDDEKACTDVRLYLTDSLRNIGRSHQLPPDWLAVETIERVAKAALGMFGFANDVVEFIRTSSKPNEKIEHVFAAISGSPMAVGTNPFISLNACYSQLMSQIATDVLLDAHNIIGHMLLREGFMSNSLFLRYSLCSTANILGLEQHAVYRALNGLHSVLYVPPPEIAHKEHIRIIHPSFAHYLKDERRSGKYWINLSMVNRHIWGRYAKILREINGRDSSSTHPTVHPKQHVKDVSSGPTSREPGQPPMSLSWPLNGSKFEKRKSIASLIYEAKFHWAQFLMPGCPCTTVPTLDSSVPITPIEEQIKTLASMNFENLERGYFTEGSDHIQWFLTYVLNIWQSSRKALEEKGVKERSLASCLCNISPDIGAAASSWDVGASLRASGLVQRDIQYSRAYLLIVEKKRTGDPTPTATIPDPPPILSDILTSPTAHARFRVSGSRPSHEIPSSESEIYSLTPAHTTHTTYMRLLSKQFPWCIEIKSEKAIMCVDVWDAIWDALQQPMLDSEWGELCTRGDVGKNHIEKIRMANKRRCAENSLADERILRCDYLGEDIWFLGLEKDESFTLKRAGRNWQLTNFLNISKDVIEVTWLIKLGQSS